MNKPISDAAVPNASSSAIAPVVVSAAEWQGEITRLLTTSVPSFFHMRAKLPTRGRTNQVLGASPRLGVVLKTYASGGENELHAHVNEDHLFVVLQGGAVFYGPKDERREVAKNDCVLFPAGSFYWFHAKEEGEPLVMLRVGAVVDASKDVLARVDIDGLPFAGDSVKNKEEPFVLSDDVFE